MDDRVGEWVVTAIRTDIPITMTMLQEAIASAIGQAVFTDTEAQRVMAALADVVTREESNIAKLRLNAQYGKDVTDAH